METVEIVGDNYFGAWDKVRVACRGIVVKDGLILLNYETKTDQWMIPGGGIENEEDEKGCCVREVEEETGVKAKPLSKEIFSLWTGPVKAHIKRGKFVSAHTHLDIDFLFEADEKQPLKIKPDENQNVIWADINEVGKSIKLVDFFVPVFENFKNKLKIKD